MSAFLRCCRAEALKLRGSLIWLAFFLVPIIPCIMGAFNYEANLEILTGGWYSLWTQQTLFYAVFFFPPLTAVYCAYLWRIEHLGHNWNLLLTAPVPRLDLFLAKFWTVLKLVCATQLWVLALFFLSGKLLQLPGAMPLEIALWLLRGTLGSTAVIGLQLLISMDLRSFSVPVFFALLGSVISLGAVSRGSGLYWPYALPLLGMNSNHSEDMLDGVSGFLSYCGASAAFLALFLTAAWMLLRHRDVKAA